MRKRDNRTNKKPHERNSDSETSRRYRLQPDEVEMLEKFRRIQDEGIKAGIHPESIKSGWIKSDEASLYFRNPNYKTAEQIGIESLAKQIVEDVKTYAPKYPNITRKKTKDGHLLVVDIADLHINKFAETEFTGDDYNSEIAVNRAIEGTKGIIQKSIGFNIDKIVFVIGNDVLNTDTLTNTTTKGTHQNTDTHWFKAFNIAKDCYIKCIELCLQVADVDVIHCPSNHDFMSGSFLAETLNAWFRNSKNVTFETSPTYRKYYKYFNNMLEFEHGHAGKVANIPLVMAQEQPIMWGETKFRYGYLHHVHHSDKTSFKSGKDYIGVNITYLRSPSSADIWHSDSQYLNMVAVEGFIHSKEMGRVSQITHYF